MKEFEVKLIISAGLTFLLTFHLSSKSVSAVDLLAYPESADEFIPRNLSDLSPQELLLAQEANAQIAKAIERNLIRLAAVISTGTDFQHRLRQPRQEDYDEDATSAPSTSSIVLPQLANIFSRLLNGGVNINSVVNQTYGLVPNVLREQVGGIVKLLIEDANRRNKASGAQTAPAQTATSAPAPKKYFRQLDDDEIDKVEKDLQAMIKKLSEQNRKQEKQAVKESSSTSSKVPTGGPALYNREAALKDLMKILSAGTNSTEVNKQVPSLFSGATGALAVLSRLGLLQPLTDFIEYEMEYLFGRNIQT